MPDKMPVKTKAAHMTRARALFVCLIYHYRIPEYGLMVTGNTSALGAVKFCIFRSSNLLLKTVSDSLLAFSSVGGLLLINIPEIVGCFSPGRC